jgi:hypothetical protein
LNAERHIEKGLIRRPAQRLIPSRLPAWLWPMLAKIGVE